MPDAVKKFRYNKKVSIIIPCRNEAKYIGNVLDDIIKQDYPLKYIEICVVEGRSSDNTRDIVEQYIDKNQIIKLLDNPHLNTTQGLNIGIQNSTGDVIFILGAHTSYPENYVSTLVSKLIELNADAVGGVIRTRPSSNHIKAKSIALVLSHSFGVGNALFRIGTGAPLEVDTVPYGCYKKEVFNKIGLFDERLVRNQDIEFNKRLKNSGGKIVLIPAVEIVYYARNNYNKLWENNFQNGLWVIKTAYFTKDLSSLSIRHFIPFLFSLFLISFPILLLISTWFVIPFILYFVLSLYFGLKLSMKNKNLTLFPFVAYAFWVLHISYGLGSIYGLLQILFVPKRL